MKNKHERKKKLSKMKNQLKNKGNKMKNEHERTNNLSKMKNKFRKNF